MRSPTQMLVACSYKSASKSEVDEYVQSVISGDEEYSNTIFEALCNDPRKARGKLEEYLRSAFPDFQVTSDLGIEECKRELVFQIQRLLSKRCSQEEFRSFFLAIESDLMMDCDDFWGDLYNGCDCFDEKWNFLDNDYLLEEAQRVLDNLLAEQAAAPNQIPRLGL